MGEMSLLGIDKTRFEPSIFVLEGKLKFILAGASKIKDGETVSEVLSNISQGIATPVYLSEADPETERDKDGCLRLTGTNFMKYAFDPKKDVFVFFTAKKVCKQCDEM